MCHLLWLLMHRWFLGTWVLDSLTSLPWPRFWPLSHFPAPCPTTQLTVPKGKDKEEICSYTSGRTHTAPPVGRLRLPGSGQAGCGVFGSCGGVSQLHPCSGKVQRPAENARLCSSVSTLPFCSCHQRQSCTGMDRDPRLP